MAKVSKTITQTNSRGINESDLTLTVSYNPEERKVDYIYEVSTYNWQKNIHTDMTAIMKEHFEEALEVMIEGIDWAEEYADQQANKKEEAAA